MRPKVLFMILLTGAVGVTAIFFLKPSSSHPKTEMTTVVDPVTPSVPTKQDISKKLIIPQATLGAPLTTPVAPLNNSSNPASGGAVVTEESASVEAQIKRLEDLQANYDAESLQAIHNELTNSNPIIRHAAIEATTQFRDRASIPVLQNLAARTTDPEEKQELLDAVEFLTLPTYTEVMAQKRQGNSGMR